MRKNRVSITLSIWMTMLLMISSFPVIGLANDGGSMPEVSFTFEQGQILASDPGDGYKIKGTTLTIKKPGIYRVTGNCPEGSIAVDKNTTDVTLILEDLDLSCSASSPLVCKKATDVDLQVFGMVTLTDSENPANEDSEDAVLEDAFEGAAIKTKADSSLLIEGTGELIADGSACKNGIKGSGGSAITIAMKESGSVAVRARNDGIAGDRIVFLSGQFYITSDSDAVQADDSLTILGGEYDIRTMDGYETKGFSPDTSSAKGLKSDGPIDISGGTFRLDTIDDAIHSDDTVRITGGNFTIDTGDDGIHADNYLTLGDVKGLERDPMITINNSNEGLESDRVSIISGKYSIRAKDDGINASGKASWISLIGSKVEPEKHSISIYGGDLYIDANGDGVDSNGMLDILGGNVEIWARPSGADNPLDYQTAMTVRNARVFAAGSWGMGLAEPSGNSQVYRNYTGRFTAGQKLCIQDGDRVLYNADAVKDAMVIFYSDPEMTDQAVLGICAETSCEIGHGFAHEWESGTTVPAAETANGIITYTCADCGKTERQTIPMTSPSLPAPEEGFRVSCTADAHSDIHVWRKSSEQEPGTLEAIVPREGTETVYCNNASETGGSGFFEFEVCVDSGYGLEEVAASDETAVIEEISANEQGNSFVYQVKDITADTQITVKTRLNEPSGEGGGGSGGGGGGTVKPDPIPPDDPEPVPDDPEPTPGPVPEVLFEDVPDDVYYNDPVKWAVSGSITNGIDETHFGPDLSCTRAQMVTFLWRAAGSPEPAAADNPFTDVEAGSYYEKAVLWAVERGITNGTSETTFSPEMTVTRGQSVTFLYRFTGEKTDAIVPFEDVEVGAYYEEAVQWAVSKEVTKGTSETTFEPESPCTRAQIVTFLYRAMAE